MTIVNCGGRQQFVQTFIRALHDQPSVFKTKRVASDFKAYVVTINMLASEIK